MRAVFIHEFGDDEGLRIIDVADPVSPSGTKVLVRVAAAGVNRADLLQLKGLYPPPKGYPERIPGLEFSGEVVGVGESVSRFRCGDRVFGITAGGAQAELVLSDESQLAKIPESMDPVQAAAVPEAFITAFDAVFAQAGLISGETLLIHAVGSGVGLAALQLAKAKGLQVFGTSRTPEKLERCSAFGLDLGITGDSFSPEIVRSATGGRGVDVILDLIGAKAFSANIAALAPKGRLMLVGLVGGRKAEFDLGQALAKRLTIIGTVLRSRSDEEKATATSAFIDNVLPLFESGAVRANLDRVFPVYEVAEAYRYVESNQNFGKVVLEF